MPKPATRIMLNLANPEMAFEASFLPVDGVGLARIEFIINNSIRIHPRALLDFAKLELPLQKTIGGIISGYPDASSYYVKTGGRYSHNCSGVLSATGYCPLL